MKTPGCSDVIQYHVGFRQVRLTKKRESAKKSVIIESLAETYQLLVPGMSQAKKPFGSTLPAW